MATDRSALLTIPAAAALLLWPAVWNGYPIVFADTGTYLSQAIHLYAGWDRPVFYSLFMLPLHLTVTLWPVVVVQALLASWVLWLVCRVLSGVSGIAFVAGAGVLSVCTWLPWTVSELMPDLFTPLLVLVTCLLAWLPERLSRLEHVLLAGLAAFMVASQQSSLPLACVLGALLLACRHALPTTAGRVFVESTRSSPSWPGASRPSAHERRGRMAGTPHARVLARPVPTGEDSPAVTGENSPAPTGEDSPARVVSRRRRWLLVVLPPALAALGLCSVNLAAHGRFAISPFGNVFLLARVIYDGPGMAVLRRDCPVDKWRLCPLLDSFPPTSDEFLWSDAHLLDHAGGPKLVSQEADAIIRTALLADPLGEARSAAANTLEQLASFASGDGLNPWPGQVSPEIARDFPRREQAAYAAARQQAGSLAVPPPLVWIHRMTAVGGVLACAVLLPVACRRRAACFGFLLAVLLALPVGAAITGSLSAPHDRYQARLMWLPPFVAVISLASLRRRPA
jgi:hypothetical protein